MDNRRPWNHCYTLESPAPKSAHFNRLAYSFSQLVQSKSPRMRHRVSRRSLDLDGDGEVGLEAVTFCFVNRSSSMIWGFPKIRHPKIVHTVPLSFGNSHMALGCIGFRVSGSGVSADSGFMGSRHTTGSFRK